MPSSIPAKPSVVRRGTLEVMLHHTEAARWDTGKLLRIIHSTATGLHFLHSCHPAVLHRDIKPGNIFVSTGQVAPFSAISPHMMLQFVLAVQDEAGQLVRRCSWSQRWCTVWLCTTGTRAAIFCGVSMQDVAATVDSAIEFGVPLSGPLRKCQVISWDVSQHDLV